MRVGVLGDLFVQRQNGYADHAQNLLVDARSRWVVQSYFERSRYVDGVNGFVTELDLSCNRGRRTRGSDGIFLVYVQGKNALVAMAWRSDWRSFGAVAVVVKDIEYLR